MKYILIIIVLLFISCNTKKEIYFIKEKIIVKTNYVEYKSHKIDYEIIKDNKYTIYFSALNNKVITKVYLDRDRVGEMIFCSTNESVLYSYSIGLWLRDGYNGSWSNFEKVECVPEISELDYQMELP